MTVRQNCHRQGRFLTRYSWLFSQRVALVEEQMQDPRAHVTICRKNTLLPVYANPGILLPGSHGPIEQEDSRSISVPLPLSTRA